MSRTPRFQRTRRQRGERGYVLLMVVLALAIMIIAMTAAVPALKTQIQRDRENEMVHRGEQYARAIRRYYRKFGRYPTRIEELEKTNNTRFLRKRYKDPMSEEGSWRLLHLADLKQAPSIAGAQPAGGLSQSPGSQSPFGSGFGQTGTPAFGSGSTPGGFFCVWLTKRQWNELKLESFCLWIHCDDRAGHHQCWIFELRRAGIRRRAHDRSRQHGGQGWTPRVRWQGKL
jgi:type II secretory pathway pseudopilin PulG